MSTTASPTANSDMHLFKAFEAYWKEKVMQCEKLRLTPNIVKPKT